MWESKPWDNDKAADWFAKLMRKSDFPSQIRASLVLVGEANTPILRAAVFCMLQFGRVYIWPINDLKKDLQLAILALERVLEDEEYCYSDNMIEEINVELDELKNRISPLL